MKRKIKNLVSHDPGHTSNPRLSNTPILLGLQLNFLWTGQQGTSLHGEQTRSYYCNCHRHIVVLVRGTTRTTAPSKLFENAPRQKIHVVARFLFFFCSCFLRLAGRPQSPPWCYWIIRHHGHIAREHEP